MLMYHTGRDAEERGHDETLLSKGVKRERKWLFHASITVNFMVYEDRTETKLLQLFAHPENSEWFSTISVISFEVSAVAERKKACGKKLVTLKNWWKNWWKKLVTNGKKLVTFFFVFYKSFLDLNFLLPLLPYLCSGVPVYQQNFITVYGKWLLMKGTTLFLCMECTEAQVVT